MIDKDGFRHNVGIILLNQDMHVFWARRIGQNAWQFPQGGIREHESPEQALYRELMEEIGLEQSDVEIIGSTEDWLKYRLPSNLIRQHQKPICIGQKQIWFMLLMKGDDSRVRLDVSEKPEFDTWKWVDYWYPLSEVVFFKKSVYKQALNFFAPQLFSAQDEES